MLDKRLLDKCSSETEDVRLCYLLGVSRALEWNEPTSMFVHYAATSGVAVGIENVRLCLVGR